MKALVPILFTKEVVEAIRILITMHSRSKISSENKYIFACGVGDARLRGWDTIQGLTKKMNLRKPNLLTPTRTQKFLATVLQLLDLSEAELTWITNHLGHTKDVHKGWYRKEDATIELTKVATVLVATDAGETRSIQNKKIDSLQTRCKCYFCLFCQ